MSLQNDLTAGVQLNLWTAAYDEALAFYKPRLLDDALRTARHAMADAHISQDEEGILRTQILLARILNSKAQFSGNRQLYEDATKLLDEALLMPFTRSKIEVWLECMLLLVQTRIFQEDLFLGSTYLTEISDAIALQGSNYWQMRYKLMQCLLFMERNEYQTAIDLALALKQKNESLPEEEVELEIQAEISQLLSQLYLKRQDEQFTLEFGLQLLYFSRQLPDAEKELVALNNIAVAYGMQGDYKTAMQYFVEAFERANTLKARSTVANCLVNIGTIYAKLFNYNAALDRYQTVLAGYADLLPRSSIVILQNNIGNVHFAHEAYPAALASYEAALAMAQAQAYREMECHNLSQCVRVHLRLGQYERAKHLSAKNEALLIKFGVQGAGQQIHLANLAELQLQSFEFEGALRQALSSLRVGTKAGDNDSVIRSYTLLSQIYTQDEQYKKALKAQRRYNELQVNLAKMQQSRLLLDVEIRYAIQEKQQRIEQLTRDNALQAQLLEQADKIEQQNALLSQANEELKQFAYVVSHDLQEPLRMIRSYTQLIEIKVAPLLSGEERDYMIFVKEGVIRLSNLLSDLLRYSTLGKQEIELTYFHAEDTLQHVKHSLKVLVEESDATITFDPLPIIYSSNSFFYQLLLNLVNNGIKFSQTHVAPHVHVSAREEAEFHVFRVSDNGIGIDKEFFDRIFIIFQRLHTRTAYAGTGIGLAICMKIIQLLGGSISVESEKGEGTTFVFRLPK